MSTYQTMDHAGWMEGNNKAIHALAKNEKPHHRHWKNQAKTSPVKLTDFQKKVCDIVGMVGGGIYNAPIATSKIDWNYGRDGVSVIWKMHELATFDFNQLTMLVFLCHEARIRCSVTSAGPRMMRLSFWQRSHEGCMATRHPNLEEAVKAFKEYLPADHRIVYKEPRGSCNGCGRGDVPLKTHKGRSVCGLCASYNVILADDRCPKCKGSFEETGGKPSSGEYVCQKCYIENMEVFSE